MLETPGPPPSGPLLWKGTFMRTLFINGSPNADGNTAALARELLAGRDYETVQLGTTKV